MQQSLGGWLKHGEYSELIVDYVAGTLDARMELEFQKHSNAVTDVGMPWLSKEQYGGSGRISQSAHLAGFRSQAVSAYR